MVCADVVLPLGCLQCYTSNPVKGLLEVYEDTVEVVLVQETFLTEDSLVEDLLYGAPCSEACQFFRDGLFHLWLQSVRYDLQHDFAWVTVEADCSVVLALLQVVFLGKYDD